MKIKHFTFNHPDGLQKQSLHKIFSSEEHEFTVQKQFSEMFESRESLVRSYLFRDHNKLEALSFLIEYIKSNNFKNIISFGAGECVLEHILSIVFPPPDFKILATDFNEYYIFQNLQ